MTDLIKRWYDLKKRPDVIIFEGWCVGAKSEKRNTLKKRLTSWKKLKTKNRFGENLLMIN